VEGLKFVASKMKVDISQIVFVWDEEKDMICFVDGRSDP